MELPQREEGGVLVRLGDAELRQHAVPQRFGHVTVDVGAVFETDFDLFVAVLHRADAVPVVDGDVVVPEQAAQPEGVDRPLRAERADEVVGFAVLLQGAPVDLEPVGRSGRGPVHRRRDAARRRIDPDRLLRFRRLARFRHIHLQRERGDAQAGRIGPVHDDGGRKRFARKQFRRQHPVGGDALPVGRFLQNAIEFDPGPGGGAQQGHLPLFIQREEADLDHSGAAVADAQTEFPGALFRQPDERTLRLNQPFRRRSEREIQRGGGIGAGARPPLDGTLRPVEEAGVPVFGNGAAAPGEIAVLHQIFAPLRGGGTAEQSGEKQPRAEAET